MGKDQNENATGTAEIIHLSDFKRKIGVTAVDGIDAFFTYPSAG